MISWVSCDRAFLLFGEVLFFIVVLKLTDVGALELRINAPHLQYDNKSSTWQKLHKTSMLESQFIVRGNVSVVVGKSPSSRSVVGRLRAVLLDDVGG